MFISRFGLNSKHHSSFQKKFIDLIGSKFTSALLLVVLLVELGCGVKITMGDGEFNWVGITDSSETSIE